MKSISNKAVVALMLIGATGNVMAAERQVFSNLALVAGGGLLGYAVNWHLNQGLSGRVAALENRLRGQGQNQAVAQPEVDNQNVEPNVEGQAVQPDANNALVPAPENNESRITWKEMLKAGGIVAGTPVAALLATCYAGASSEAWRVGYLSDSAVVASSYVAAINAAPAGVSLASAYLHQYGSPKERAALKVLCGLGIAGSAAMWNMFTQYYYQYYYSILRRSRR